MILSHARKTLRASWELKFHPINEQAFLKVIASTFKGTTVKLSSRRLAESEIREMLESNLFYEIKDCTFCNDGGVL
jgi:hypothetical protein